MYQIGCKIDEVRVDGNLKALRRDLQHFADLRMEAVEIPVHGVDAIKGGLPDKQRFREVQQILSDYDFAYSVHSPNPLNLMDPWNPEIHYAVFKASLDFTQAIGSRILVYHAGRFVSEETFPYRDGTPLTKTLAHRLMEIEREQIQRLSEEYPQVTICIENARPYLHHSPYCYGEKVELLLKQVVQIGRPNVRINLDMGHLYLSAQFYRFDPLEAVRTLAPFISHTHVHDNFGGAVYYHEKIQTHQIPFGRGDSHMPVGWGEIPIAQLLSLYLPSYEGMLIMELRSRYFPHLKESLENLKAAIDTLGLSSS